MWLNDLYSQLDPVAFSLGALQVRWYGLAYLAGFLLGALVIVGVARHWKLNFDPQDIWTVVLFIAFFGIAGGRLGYCLIYGDGYYLAHPDQILAIWRGGMSIHTGVLGAFLGGYLGCKTTKLSFATMCDLAGIAVPIGLFFGRCANFVNGELWGKPTDLPWGVAFASGGGVYRHPSQLYEALLEGIVLFAILIILARKVPPRPQGTFIGLFLLLYGIFRFAIEFVRVPDAQIGYLAGWLTMGQLLCVPFIVAGIALLVWAVRTKRPQRLALEPASLESRHSK